MDTEEDEPTWDGPNIRPPQQARDTGNFYNQFSPYMTTQTLVCFRYQVEVQQRAETSIKSQGQSCCIFYNT
jgi:hypothetical protein